MGCLQYHSTNVAMKKMTATIFNDIAICEELDPEVYEDFEWDKSDEEESSIEEIQEAYWEMYYNWMKVCNVNKSLKDNFFWTCRWKWRVKKCFIQQ